MSASLLPPLGYALRRILNTTEQEVTPFPQKRTYVLQRTQVACRHTGLPSLSHPGRHVLSPLGTPGFRSCPARRRDTGYGRRPAPL